MSLARTSGRPIQKLVAALALVACSSSFARAYAWQLRLINLNKGGGNTADYNTTGPRREFGSAVALNGDATSEQICARYECVLAVDVAAGGNTESEGATADYFVTYGITEAAGVPYTIRIEAHRRGSYTIVNDHGRFADVQITTPITASSLNWGTLAPLQFPGDSVTNENHSDEDRNIEVNRYGDQTGSICVSGVGTGSELVETLSFTWSMNVISHGGGAGGDEAALRLGRATTGLNRITAGDYPGPGSRNQADDGHFVCITYEGAPKAIPTDASICTPLDGSTCTFTACGTTNGCLGSSYSVTLEFYDVNGNLVATTKALVTDGNPNWCGAVTVPGPCFAYPYSLVTSMEDLFTGAVSTEPVEGFPVTPATDCGDVQPFSPLASWRFDDNLDIGLDSSPNDFQGVLGAATVVPGPCGNALHFLPDNNVHEYTIPHDEALNLTGAMTGMALIRPLGPHSTDNNPSCAEGTIFSKGGNYWFQVAKNNDQLIFQNEGSGTDLAVANISLCEGEWTHVAFVRAADGKTVRFYKNGHPIGLPTTLANAATPNLADVMVGNYGFGSNPSDCEFNGEIDELRLYDFALSPAEVKAVFQNSCPVDMCPPTLVRFCGGAFAGIVSCPCGNPQVPAAPPVKGCDNFFGGGSGGAALDGSGIASLDADSLELQFSGGVASSLTIVFQGTTNTANTRTGAGTRCVGGTLKRLYKGNTAAGAIVFPNNGVPFHTQSLSKGYTITAPVTLYYYCAYRNSAANGQPGCPGLTFGFNSSNAGAVSWSP